MTTGKNRADALTEKQRHAVDEAAKVLRDNWEHGTAEDLLMAFLPESSDPQPAPSPADERAAMQDAFERSEFYFNGESPVERADNWKIWVAAWKAARRPVRTFVKYIITGVAELYRAQGMNNIAGEILSLIDTERAASANETGAEGADALAHEVWSAAQRAAFDSEVGSVIADAATRGIAWMSFKAGAVFARAASANETGAEVSPAQTSRLKALIDAIEGECDGLAIDENQAARILLYLDSTSPNGIVRSPAMAAEAVAIPTVVLEDRFEFEQDGTTHAVRGDRAAIKALVKWREYQRKIAESALRNARSADDDSEYKRMFEDAVRSLAVIDEALGIDPDEAGGAAPILEAIERLKVSGAIPEAYALVPIEPTVSMLVDGFESWPDPIFSTPEEWGAFEKMTGCQQATHKARLCYSAMLTAAPQPPAQADTRVGLTDEQLETIRRGLTAAKHFIANGIALGFIRMPDADCPDPAHDTPKLIDGALAILATHPGQPEPRAEVTDAMVAAAAKTLSDRSADACNINRDDNWMIYGECFQQDAMAALEAALAARTGASS